MKAISRQRQLFRSSPPCQPPFAPQQECGRVCVCVCVCVCVWSPSLPPERPGRSWCQPLPHQNAGSTPSAKALTRLCPPVCLPDWRVPVGDTAVQLPAAPMKSLFDSSLDWLGSLGTQAASYQLSPDWSHQYTSNSRTAAYAVSGLSRIHIFMRQHHNCILPERVKLRIIPPPSSSTLWVNSNTPPNVSRTLPCQHRELLSSGHLFKVSLFLSCIRNTKQNCRIVELDSSVLTLKKAVDNSFN